MNSCKLCGQDCEREGMNALDTLHKVKCDRCGTYEITDDALDTKPEKLVQENLHLISAVARNYSKTGQRFRVEEKLLEDESVFAADILSKCPRTVQEKSDHLLAYIGKISPNPGIEVLVNCKIDYPLFFCKNEEELNFYFNHAKERNFIWVSPESLGSNVHVMLRHEGWGRIESKPPGTLESKQAFVAMWFDDEVNQAFSQGIAKLRDDTGYVMIRIDKTQFNDKICDKILADIRKSRFLIADVTGHRQRVYFEAGFAMGLGLPVIWTCRKDHMEDCHFDTRQYNHIVWESPEELRQKLRDRVLATIGPARG